MMLDNKDFPWQQQIKKALKGYPIKAFIF